jgi:hypothetical protein
VARPAGRQPSELSREDLVRVVERVRDALYRDKHDGTLDPDKTWDADTVEAVAQALVDAGLRPAAPPGGPEGVDG